MAIPEPDFYTNLPKYIKDLAGKLYKADWDEEHIRKLFAILFDPALEKDIKEIFTCKAIERALKSTGPSKESFNEFLNNLLAK